MTSPTSPFYCDGTHRIETLVGLPTRGRVLARSDGAILCVFFRVTLTVALHRSFVSKKRIVYGQRPPI